MFRICSFGTLRDKIGGSNKEILRHLKESSEERVGIGHLSFCFSWRFREFSESTYRVTSAK